MELKSGEMERSLRESVIYLPFPEESFCRWGADGRGGDRFGVVLGGRGAGLHGMPDRKARGQVSNW